MSKTLNRTDQNLLYVMIRNYANSFWKYNIHYSGFVKLHRQIVIDTLTKIRTEMWVEDQAGF